MDMPANVPTGVEHLRMLALLRVNTKKASEAKLQDHSVDFIGSCLAALYEAATCHRKCHGGGHVLESLCGRAYNLGAAAYELISAGYYDEALNLIRSMGEISNLISLSVVDKEALREWLSSDAKTRLRKFSPAAVRGILELKGKELMYADKDWYSNLCESYTHVTPATKPNMHNDRALAHVGGLYQSEGLAKSINELATVLGFIAMLICGYFKFDDLFTEISNHLAIG